MGQTIQSHKDLLHNLAIAQKVQLHYETAELIKDDAAQVDLIADIVAEYEEDATELNTAYNESLKSMETEDMVVKDSSRDSIIVEVRRRVNFAYKNPTTEAEKHNARLIKFEIDKYDHAITADYKAQTSAVRKLVTDVHTQQPALDELGLNDLFDRLEVINNEFEVLYLSRSEALEDKRERGPLKEKADKANKSFDVICTAIEGLLLVKVSPAVKAALEGMVSHINAQIHDYTIIYHRHAKIVAKHRKDKEKEDEGTQTPDNTTPNTPGTTDPNDQQKPENTPPVAPNFPDQNPSDGPHHLDPDEHPPMGE
ncbi:MAG: DUF6261 family protein [Tannerellaceae bacterium]|jgi:hypothetical protein|nr:DUF6261 family protein [Tannerellaceae bacterium]